MQGLPFFVPLHVPGATLDVYGPRQADGPLGDVFAQMMRPPFFPIRPTRPRRRRPLPRHRRRRLPGRAREGALALGPPRRARRSGSASSGTARRSRTSPITGRAPSSSDADDYIPPEVLELCDGVDLLIHDAQHTLRRVRAEAALGPLHRRLRGARRARGRRAQPRALPPRPAARRRRRWTESRSDASDLAASMGVPELIVARDRLQLAPRGAPVGSARASGAR